MDRVADLAQVAQAEHAAGDLADAAGRCGVPAGPVNARPAASRKRSNRVPNAAPSAEVGPETLTSCRFALTASMRRRPPRSQALTVSTALWVGT